MQGAKLFKIQNHASCKIMQSVRNQPAVVSISHWQSVTVSTSQNVQLAHPLAFGACFRLQPNSKLSYC